MKANELMIGDFVTRQNYENKAVVCKIIELSKNSISVEFDNGSRSMGASEDSINPIHITSEILEKNGFTKGGMFGNTYYLSVEDFEISVYFAHANTQLIIEKRNGKEIINILNVEYLHILQHALRLCGIEKTIEL